MANDINKNKIQQAIKDFAENNLTKSAINLFQTLGYNTDRQAPLAKKNFNEFKEDYIDQEKNFNEGKALCNEWIYVDLLFQLSKEEILKQSSLFDTKQVDNTVIETYLFFSIELNNKSYTRTALSNITREVNKLFPMPVMILFKHGNTLTLSVINRRLHKRDLTKDVLEKVTQIKDINIEKPHRAHIEILFDLSFGELQRKYSFTNFIELHNAWQKTLDIQELNKRFFNELANWYFWATTQVAFPDDEIKEKDIRNATGVIRLITRLMFVWFLKEKNLVPDELFDHRILKSILKFSDKKKSTFYKSILQNLFFATLNTEMGKRKFRSKQEQNRDGHYFIHNVFRYEDEFIEPIKTLETYFYPIPFLNGGLFECLDKQIEENGKRKSIRIDGFSDRDDNILKVDDDLFFGEEKTVDLTAFYDSKSKRKQYYKVRGLIHILDSYKFTITENTPIDEEIALDPELLGKVFENLLANYNPETKTTARKQTGSFYTPREIVNYMVDESLIAYLKQQLDEENDTKENLSDLLSYSEKEPDFSDDQKDKLIKAIDDIKILDPACGSGAFPMGVLHKLVHILHKVDPKNKKWQKRQLNKVDKLIADAEDISDTKTRNIVIADLQKNREGIIEAFENNELDYGRKLFLIENCIYGVDIQPIATQISKLRFFISLIVDQRNDERKDNIGIRPLPNLETKFIAANTLIELEKENANLFTNPEIETKKAELKKVRHKYFEARTPKTKEKCRQEDKRLRNELADILTKDHYLQPEAAKKLAAWDPYDQNTSASFFDAVWMFGLNDGFDVVIGNPPYGADLKPHEKIILDKEFKQLSTITKNSAIYFIYKSSKQLKERGINSFIIPKSISYSNGWSKCANYLIENGLKRLIDCGRAFENVLLEMVIYIRERGASQQGYINGNYFNGNIIENTLIKSDFYNKYKVLLTGLTQKEIDIIKRIYHAHDFSFGDFTYTVRGLNWQSKAKKYPGKTPIFRGAQLNKYKIDKPTDFIELSNFNYDEYSYQLRPKILNQLAIAHVKNPYPHFYLQACLDNSNILVYETIACTFTKNKELELKFLLALNNSKMFEWLLYKLIYCNAIRSTRYDDIYISRVPTPNLMEIDQSPFISIVDYILLQNDETTSYFFRQILDAMVYEIYFPKVIQSANCEILKHLTNLPQLLKGNDEETFNVNFNIIAKVHKDLIDPNHPVSLAMFKMDTIEEIRIIEGKQ